jgi:CRISPR/Cas system CMR-associated protein Cmr5 small subunit
MDILERLKIVNEQYGSYTRSHVTMKVADKIAEKLPKGKSITKKEIDKAAKKALDKSDYRYYENHWDEIKSFLHMSLNIDYHDIKD